MIPRVYIDFNDALGPNSYALICRGCLASIEKQGLELQEGMQLEVSDGEMFAVGKVGKTKAGMGWPGANVWMIDVDESTWRDLEKNRFTD